MTSNQIADRIQLSVRTVKKDMILLADYLKSHGAVLKSKNNLGYWIEISDEAKYIKLYHKLSVLFNSEDYYRIQYMGDKSDAILRILLANDQFIRLDEIAERLYLTKSALREEFKYARTILESYNLHIESEPNHGSRVAGYEFCRRMCLLRQLNYSSYQFDGSETKEFDALFDYPLEDTVELRHMINRALISSGLRITDNFINWIVRYCIMSMRRSAEHPLQFSEARKKKLRTYPQYQLAAGIMESSSLGLRDDEVYGFETLLLMWNDISPEDLEEHQYAQELSEIDALTPQIIESLRREAGIDFTDHPAFRKMIRSSLIPIIFQVDCGIQKFSIYGGVQCNDEVRRHPFCMMLGSIVLHFLRDRYTADFSVYNFIYLAARFTTLFTMSSLPRPRKRIAVCSSLGIGIAESIKETVRNYFPKDAIESIEARNLYELRQFRQDEIDCVLLNMPKYAYLYSWPFYHVSMSPTQQELEKIRSQYLSDYESMPDVQKRIAGMIHICRNIRINDVNLLPAYINQIINGDSSNWDRFYEQFHKQQHLSYCNQISLVFLTKSICRASGIYLLSFDRPLLWGEQKLSALIIAAVDCEGNLQNGVIYSAFSTYVYGNASSLVSSLSAEDDQSIISRLSSFI